MSSSDTFLVSFALGTLYITLDYMVHTQFDYTDHFLERCLNHTPIVMVCLIFIFDRLSRLKSNKWAQMAFMIAAAGLGSRVVWITTVDHTLGAMLQTPSLIVLWTYLIMELDLGLALTSLIGVLIYYYRKRLMELVITDPAKPFKDL
jgi:hypothetical protein